MPHQGSSSLFIPSLAFRHDFQAGHYASCCHQPDSSGIEGSNQPYTNGWGRCIRVCLRIGTGRKVCRLDRLTRQRTLAWPKRPPKPNQLASFTFRRYIFCHISPNERILYARLTCIKFYTKFSTRDLHAPICLRDVAKDWRRRERWTREERNQQVESAQRTLHNPHNL